MKKLIYIFWSFVAIVLLSCEHDISLPSGGAIGVLCINGYLHAGESAHYISVSKTDYDGFSTDVYGAEAKMYVNDQLVGTSVYHSDINNKLYFYHNISSGDKVRFEVRYKDQLATYEGIVPQAPTGIECEGSVADYSYNSDGNRENYFNSARLMLKFTDSGHANNYYRIACGYRDSIVMPFTYNTNDTVYYFYYDVRWKGISSGYRNYDYQTDKYIDTTYTTYSNVSEPNSEFYYQEAPSLTDEESSVEMEDFDFMVPSIENKYRIMSNKRFRNSSCDMVIYKTIDSYAFNMKYNYREAYYNLSNEQCEAISPRLFLDAVVRVEAIDADQYYFLKVLNALESDYYSDYSELTGAVRIPSNVSGGTGNIFLSAYGDVKVSILTDYKVSIVYSNDDTIYDY